MFRSVDRGVRGRWRAPFKLLVLIKPVILDETPEEAAIIIAKALDFLEREADAVGLTDVSNCIRKASAKAREYHRDRLN